MAFEHAKELLQSAELLVHFNTDKELILASDASNHGVGAVLSHRMEDGTEQLIGYVSRSLNIAQRNYSSMEEARAVNFGLQKFHQFHYGRRFTFETDHQPLEGLLNEKKGIPTEAAPQMQRWALTLTAYEYTISYKAAPTNGNADASSRLPLPEVQQSVPILGETMLLMEHLETQVSSSQVKAWTRKDPILSQVLRYTLEGLPAAFNSEELKPYLSRQAELSIAEGCVVWGTRFREPRLHGS